MKNLLLFLWLFISSQFSIGQTYNPTNFTISNKAYGIAQAAPTDARSYFYDASLFIQRPYQSTAEVLSYLNLTKYRVGQFPIYISSGTLQSGGTFTGGTITEYWFKDGTANGNLVAKINYSDVAARAAVVSGVLNGPLIQKSTSVQQVAALSSTELATSSGWTSTGWTGNFSSGFTHTAGNTSVLTFPVTLTNGALYQVQYVQSGISTGFHQISMGGVTDTKFQIENVTYFFSPKISDVSQGLKFIPSSDYTGTISGVSIKQISDFYLPLFKIQDNSNGNVFEIRSSVSGLQNTWLGESVGAYSSTGGRNVGVGGATLVYNTSGYENTGFGVGVLAVNTIGHNNTGSGFHALFSNISGRNNVATGTYSLTANTTGDKNTGTGTHSLNNNTTGESNVANGEFALGLNEIGSFNTAMGTGALQNNRFSSYSTAVGFQALHNAINAGNTALGNSALYSLTDGIDNLALGNGAGASLTGSGNTIIGNGQDPLTAGSYNTIIGRAGTISPTINFATILLDGAGHQRFTGLQDGSVGINNPSPQAALDIPSTTSGILIPRMSTTQRDAMGSLIEGMQIYNLTTHTINFWNGTVWKAVTTD